MVVPRVLQKILKSPEVSHSITRTMPALCNVIVGEEEVADLQNL